MTPDIVVDIGNSRMKWGWFDASGMFRHQSLDADQRERWNSVLAEIGNVPPLRWAVASVHPNRLAKFLDWLAGRGDTVAVLDDRSKLPIRIGIRDPESVGIDRLLGAIAANARRRPDYTAVTVDAGTAVTINLVDDGGTFRGGAILPGFRLMAESLHRFTAQLPLVNPDSAATEFPGQGTVAAMRLGIRCAVEGAVTKFLEHLGPCNVEIFYTGGYGSLLLPEDSQYCVPTLNLEGIRIAAGALP